MVGLGVRDAGGQLPGRPKDPRPSLQTLRLDLPLAPGYVETPINRDFFATEGGQALVRRIPQRRLGRVEDLEAPLVLLASDASAYMTGAVIAVDGGHAVSSL